ncbi:hypothetical protein [Archangium violaceum]|uniref:hypothetical protein n=1 Tax=Archangium violaceum TaxID=83451 RepID=UPI0036DD217E
MTDALATLDNGAIKIESGLFKLYTAVTSSDFKSIRDQLPSIIKDTVLKTLGGLLEQVTAVVRQFLNTDILSKITSVLEAGKSVVESATDLLPEAARNLAETAARFIKIVLDFAAAGLNHIKAIVDLLRGIGIALSGGTPTLDAATVAILTPAT